MKRTKNPPENLFGLKRTKGISRRVDFEDSEARDKEFLFPLLHKLGFDAQHVRREYVSEHIPPHDMERYARFVMRVMLHGGCGKMVEIWHPNDINKRFFAQTQIIKSAKSEYMKYYPTFQVPPEFARKQMEKPEALQRQNILKTLDEFNIYFLIVTETGQYWLDTYGALPLDETYLTYRSKNTKQLDRLATKAGYQFGKFHSIERGLVEKINDAIKYTNRNKRYESK
jgi:hypothetical protein